VYERFIALKPIPDGRFRLFSHELLFRASKAAKRIGMDEASLPECHLRATEKAATLA